MRIAILGDALDLQYAGVHVYLKGLLTALSAVADGNEYLLVRPNPGAEFPTFREIVVPINKDLPGHQYWRALTAIPRRMVAEKVDVVVEPAHFGPFNLPQNIRRITVIHDLTPVLFPEFHAFPSGLVHRLVLPGIFRRADRIIANSAYTRSDIERHYPAALGKITVVPPGVASIFRPTQNGDVLRKYGIREPYLLTVGTIEPRKNLLAMLRAYELFRQNGGPVWQWVVAGKKGWKTSAFFSALSASPYREDVLLTGYTDHTDLPALYSMAQFFVYPSVYEGFGLPVLEAMACGVPVLVAGTSSLPEVGGPAAQYMDPHDIQGFAGKMQQLATDSRLLADLRQRSVEQAARFQWEAAAQTFREVLRGLGP